MGQVSSGIYKVLWSSCPREIRLASSATHKTTLAGHVSIRTFFDFLNIVSLFFPVCLVSVYIFFIKADVSVLLSRLCLKLL